MSKKVGGHLDIVKTSPRIDTSMGLCLGAPTGSIHELVLKNVMGQEDIYRLDPETGQRDLNPQTARVVATTVAPTTLVMEYGAVSQDPITKEESWTLDQIHEELTPTGYHDFIVAPVSPDTLYAFRVTVTDPVTEEVLQSGIHFFRTENFIIITTELFAYPFVVVIPAAELIEVLVNQFNAQARLEDPPHSQSFLNDGAVDDVFTIDPADLVEQSLTNTELTISVNVEFL